MTAIRGNGPVPAAGQKPAVSAAPGLDPAHVYALGADPDESARLTRQSDELRPEAEALLARIGLRPGHAVADLGCGPRGILELLSGAVAPGGRCWAWTPTRRTSPWPRRAPAGPGWATSR
jgi:predicted methyltransferase